MDDVIKRQDALTEIRKDGKWLEEQGVTSMTTHERELRDTFILRELPSAQKKGHWSLQHGQMRTDYIHSGYIPHKNYCSCCEKDSPYDKRWKFCPNCGADMRGEDDG